MPSSFVDIDIDFEQSITPQDDESISRFLFSPATTYPPIMSQPSLTNFIVKRPWLKKWMTPLANWYTDASGYRKLGLRYASANVRPPAHSCILFSFRAARIAIEEGPHSPHITLTTLYTNRADDLIPEESDVVLLALKRLPPKEAYDRVFRMRRAFQVRRCILSPRRTHFLIFH